MFIIISGTGVRDITETNASFVAALRSPATDQSVSLVFSEVQGSTSSITITVKVVPGKYLLVIPKEELKRNLIPGTTYTILVSAWKFVKPPALGTLVQVNCSTSV